MPCSPSPHYKAHIPCGGESRNKRSCPRWKNSESASYRSARSARGFLTGKITEETKFDAGDFRNTVPRFNEENRKANQALVDLVGSFAQQKNATPAQIALAWILAQKPWIVPIPGTTKLQRLEENLGATAVELTQDDLRRLNEATATIAVQGARYSEGAQKMIDR